MAKRPAAKNSSPAGDRRLVAILGNYVSALRAATEAELSGLNSSVNWALSMTLAVVAFISQFLFLADAPSVSSLIFALILAAGAACMLVHFCIRTAKAYSNIIRFSTIERSCLNYLMETPTTQLDPSTNDDYDDLVLRISEYHCAWKSPISLSRIVIRSVLSFGFIYHLMAISAIWVYIATQLFRSERWAVLAIGAGMVISIILEIVAFKKSAYGRSVRIDLVAESLA